MRDAGYVNLTLFLDRGKIGHGSLTWAGYDFLDAARNETVWRRVWGSLRETGETVPVEVMKSLLIEGAKRWGMEAVFGSGGQ